MCILMLYNGGDSFSYEDIQKQTGIHENVLLSCSLFSLSFSSKHDVHAPPSVFPRSPQDLPRHLLSLAHPKIRVLTKSPNTKSIENNHMFTYNKAYTVSCGKSCAW